MNFKLKHKGYTLSVLAILAVITGVFMLFWGIAPMQKKTQGAINADTTSTNLINAYDYTGFTPSTFATVNGGDISSSNPYK